MLWLVYERFAADWINMLPFLLFIIFLNSPWIGAGAEAPLVLISIFAMAFTFRILSHDEQHCNRIASNGQPVPVKTAVTVKYAFHIAAGMCIIAAAALARVVLADVPLWAAALQTLPPLAVFVIFVSVFFPLYYRYGMEPIRIAMAVYLLALLLALPLLDELAKKHAFWGMLDVVQSLPAFPLRLVLACGTFVGLLVSWGLSVRWHARTEQARAS